MTQGIMPRARTRVTVILGVDSARRLRATRVRLAGTAMAGANVENGAGMVWGRSKALVMTRRLNGNRHEAFRLC